MNEEQIIRIIDARLAHHIKQSKYVFDRPIQILDGNDITLASEHGTRIGTATGQKFSLWGVTPIIQPTAPSEATGGTVVDVECRSVQNGLRSVLISTGIMKA